ncbi:hypothetical protein CR513_05196, partial [Mucuna pruriens]
MILVPEKFEAKISIIKESCNLQTLTITELTSKLHSQEQRVSMRNEEVVEEKFPLLFFFTMRLIFSLSRSYVLELSPSPHFALDDPTFKLS